MKNPWCSDRIFAFTESDLGLVFAKSGIGISHVTKASLAVIGFIACTLPAAAFAQDPDMRDPGDNGRGIAAENVEDEGMPQAFIDERRDDLISVASALPGYARISGVALEEMDGDRRLEGIVVSSEDCSEQYGCAWTAFSDAPEGWKQIGKGYAHEVSFFRPAGDDGYVIDTDGVQWVYRGGKAIALSTGEIGKKRPLSPRDGDYEVLAKVKPEFDSREEMDLVRYEIDIDLDGTPETVLVVQGLKYGLGAVGRPYLILDHVGNVLVDSASPDLPVIFPGKDGGLIVNPVPSGLQILELR